MYWNKNALITQNIKYSDDVLDVGFAGQAITPDNPEYPHALLKKAAHAVYGVDIILPAGFDNNYYLQASAEDFNFDRKFDVIVALDLIEHLSNPGLFLQCCKRHLKPEGTIIITTPNAFNLFSLIEKITHKEPNINTDHTLYLNKPTLDTLLRKNGLRVLRWDTMYDMLGNLWQGGFKRKITATIYACLSFITDKYTMTMVAFVVL
jgi:SAM-dependent methyltransferase